MGTFRLKWLSLVVAPLALSFFIIGRVALTPCHMEKAQIFGLLGGTHHMDAGDSPPLVKMINTPQY